MSGTSGTQIRAASGYRTQDPNTGALRVILRGVALLGVCSILVGKAHGQIALSTAVDLALRTSPRVMTSQADVERSRAILSESKDVFIPTVVAGSGLGYSYGFPVGQPTIFNFTAQSLVFNFSQSRYIRAAHLGLSSATLALMDVREAVAADAALTYFALDHDLKREAALRQQTQYSARLAVILQERVDAGVDTAMEMTRVKLGAAQIRLALLRAEDETSADRAHLARLTGLPAGLLTTDTESIPATPAETDVSPSELGPLTPGVAAAYASAWSKQAAAEGDRRYLYRPQLAFAAQYNRFAKFNGYAYYYNHFQQNNAGIGVQLSLPLFDVGRQAKARESAAEASRALHDADYQRDQAREEQMKSRHSNAELRARVEIATLDQQLSQQQLDVLLLQLTQTSNGVNPKDEQNSRIAERERYLTVLDATFQLRQAEITLLRETGQLEQWLKDNVPGTLSAPVSAP